MQLSDSTNGTVLYNDQAVKDYPPFVPNDSKVEQIQMLQYTIEHTNSDSKQVQFWVRSQYTNTAENYTSVENILVKKVPLKEYTPEWIAKVFNSGIPEVLTVIQNYHHDLINAKKGIAKTIEVNVEEEATASEELNDVLLNEIKEEEAKVERQQEQKAPTTPKTTKKK